jgi:hypothetical protein
MKGSLRQRGAASWELRVYAGTDPATRKRRYRTATVTGNRADAERALARLVADVRSERTIGSINRVGVAGRLVRSRIDVVGGDDDPRSQVCARPLPPPSPWWPARLRGSASGRSARLTAPRDVVAISGQSVMAASGQCVLAAKSLRYRTRDCCGVRSQTFTGGIDVVR